ncbi:MAG TPA: FAD-dependent oxidoreductase, partial [Candidatus Saccharimonadia bacterium]|nr:FAD-dependent oxidoreductase [Candidatus Saccharimonadia bacterium]
MDAPGDRHEVVIIGAGMAGLAAADELVRRGRSVRIIEAGPAAGGLARAIRVGGEPIEAYYHHIFPQDVETHALLERLGLKDRLEWHFGSMAILHGGTVFPFDSPLDLLRFRPLGLPSRVRAGLALATQLVRRDRRTMDRRSAAAEATRWFGATAYDLLWRPLLVAKFGSELHDRVAMAWLVARIRQRAGARRPGGDSLGYLRGSLGALVEAFVQSIESTGVVIETATRVTALTRNETGWTIAVEGPDGPRTIEASSVIAAT